MSLLSTQPLPAFLALISVALIINSILYGLFRFIEKRNQLILAIAALGIPSFLISLNVSLSLNTLKLPPSYPVFFVIIPAFGALLHLNSGGHSKNAITAFLMMLSISISAALLHDRCPGVVSLWRTIFTLTWWNLYPAIALNLLLKSQLLASPFLLWVCKNARLRPGIDKPLSD